MGVNDRFLNINLAVKDKSKAKEGADMLDKLCLIQYGGVEVHHFNLIWEYSPSLIIALAPNL